MRWKKIAMKLWKVIDDIDTAGKIYKPQKNEYVNYTFEAIRQRFAYIGCDGYNLRRRWTRFPKRYRETKDTVYDKPFKSIEWKLLRERVVEMAKNKGQE